MDCQHNHKTTIPVSTEISSKSRWILYLIVSVMTLQIVGVELWQIEVIRGIRMEFPMGAQMTGTNNRHITVLPLPTYSFAFQYTVYVASAFCAWSHRTALARYLFSMMGFYLVYCDIFTTITSLGFGSQTSLT